MHRSDPPLAAPLLWLGFAVLAVFALTASRDYAVPVALAVLLWFLVNGIADALQRAPGIGRRLPRRMAQLVAGLVIAGLMVASVSVIADNLGDLATGVNIPESPLFGEARVLLERVGLETGMTRDDLLARVPMETLVASALAFVTGLIGDAGLVFLFAVFLLVDERFYEAKLRAMIPDPARRDRLRESLGDISAQTRTYLWLMTLISAGVGAVTAAVCWAAGVQGAAFWGFLAFALNFIPTIGSILGVAAPALFALVTLGDPWALAMLLTALAATQIVAGEVVVPRVMGDRLNLSTFVIMLTLVVWGAMWGPAGLFLAVPITVILIMIVGRFAATRPIAILLSRDGVIPEPVHPEGVAPVTPPAPPPEARPRAAPAPRR